MSSTRCSTAPKNLIMQQRAFAKHMLRVTSPGQQGLGDLAGNHRRSALVDRVQHAGRARCHA